MLEINLEEGRPAADTAIRRLTYSIHREKAARTKAFKIIHGYGSSGTGGKIRVEARRYLDGCVRKGQIRGYIPGEELSIFDERTRKLLDDMPELSKDRDLGRSNNGITVVIL